MSHISNITVQKICVWVPRITGVVSILSSSAIIYMMVANRKETIGRKTHHRLLFGMSIIDIIQSTAFTATSAPMPKGDYYGAIGNNTTCAIQGFCIQLGVAVPCYNACLCIYYLLTIRYHYSFRKFRQQIEPLCHGVSIMFPLATAIASACLGLFNGRGGSSMCYIPDSTNLEGSFFYSFIFSAVPLIVCLVLISCSMTSIYFFILKRNHSMRRFSFTSGNPSAAMIEKERNAAWQALLFTSALFLTYFWASIAIILTSLGVMETGDNFAFNFLAVAQSLFLPLQGFWDLIVYSRPIVKSLRKRAPEMPLTEALQLLILYPSKAYDQALQRRRSFCSGLQTSNRVIQDDISAFCSTQMGLNDDPSNEKSKESQALQRTDKLDENTDESVQKTDELVCIEETDELVEKSNKLVCVHGKNSDQEENSA